MIERRRIEVQGTVQGVGFRPFVYRLAREMALAGWVVNSAQGASIEVEAEAAALDSFDERLRHELPRPAEIRSLHVAPALPTGELDFRIEQSVATGALSAHILPDLATCPDCLRELLDPRDRRYRYPFINCTHCGPRYSILRGLPYDRPKTTMAGFPLCPDCRAEYENPLNRRFHAQPVACPECGPHLTARDSSGVALSERERALELAEEALQAGKIVALKGLGGFQLLVDARNDEAVRTLRERKGRDAKPFAVMFPSIDAIQLLCEVNEAERELLESAAAPIVLLQRKYAASVVAAVSLLPNSRMASDLHWGEYRGVPASAVRVPPLRYRPSELSDGPFGVSELVAPDNPYLGAFLPYTPLHHLLLGDLGFPVVATSANLSGDPICTDLAQLLERMPAVADLILDHNRPIARPLDDSVVAVVLGKPLMIRRARGYAPQPVAQFEPGSVVRASTPVRAVQQHGRGGPDYDIVATGSQQKNTIALLHGGDLFLSQHLGDMDAAAATTLMESTVDDLQGIYGARPQFIACDAHPDYASTRLAESIAAATRTPLRPIQHHRAHLLSCMLEHRLQPPILGITWDGTGYGDDGTIWGGEFLRVDSFDDDPNHSIRRVAHLRPFPLPGGDAAAHEPRRSLLGLLYAAYGESAPWALLEFAPSELRLLRGALRAGVNAPLTSSMGRLFDAVAALLGLRQRTSFEGEAAMALQFAAERAAVNHNTDECLLFALTADTGEAGAASSIIECRPMLDALLAEVQAAGGRLPATQVEGLALRFHNTLAQMAVQVARRENVPTVALSGGCFQNRLLLERTVTALERAGFTVYWQQRIPCNDGGIAAGQIYGAYLAA